MNEFPQTKIGNIPVSRLIIGTNWFLGWSHCTEAKDRVITDTFADYRKIAEVLEVFFRAGVNTIMGQIRMDSFYHAVQEAEQRTGVEAAVISTPEFPVERHTAAQGFDMDAVSRVLDIDTARGAKVCMPHMATTDRMLDRCACTLRRMDSLCRAIRERGMVPGLSTHMPESIMVADASGLDVETYISIYNAMGFLMPLEVDWTARVIENARKPVITIKPLAAGQLRPLQGLNFVWNTIRPQDMVTVGTMSAGEAAEVIELSLSILDRRPANIQLQETRSKKTVRAARG